jgi:hypothetical protein
MLAPLVAVGCSHVARTATARVTPTQVDVRAALPKPGPVAEPDVVCARGPLEKPSTEPESAITCDPATAALEPLELSIACARSVPGPTPTARVPWDHVQRPVYLDKVEQRFGLTTEERAHLMKDGFVVASRLSYPSYAPALHDVYRSELPLFVSVDAVMHAVYRSNDTFIARLESDVLQPLTTDVLTRMHDELRRQPNRYDAQTATDVDLYLTVARSLLTGTNERSVLGVDVEAAAMEGLAKKGSGIARVRLFGRERLVDFAQFRPRGHYASDAAERNPDGADLSRYFVAAMWLSRIEMNLVSRSSQSSSPDLDPAETPHEGRVAMALADLARASGAIDGIARMDRAWSLLAGGREDVSPMALLSMMDEGRIDLASKDAPEKLRARIGNGFVRTVRTHIQAEGSHGLPVIATMLGPRVTPDSAATRPLVHPEVFDRHEVPMTDIAFALGHDRALAYEAEELGARKDLMPGLQRARELTQAPSQGADLYGGWLGAINALSATPDGIVPSFMETPAYQDLRMDSAIAAYGQLRHNNILLVPTTYDEPGCEIPDGFVEPARATYGALIAYADRGARVTRELSPDGEKYFLRLGRVLRVLQKISEHELLAEPLTTDEQRFLAMVTEISYGRRGGYSSGPSGSGWYFEMFSEAKEGLTDAAFVADYFASPSEGTAFYAGVSDVRMGLFVVDTGGPPRVMVGPVARAFQATGPFGNRYKDSDVPRIAAQDPWAQSYTVAQVAEPKLVLTARARGDARQEHTGEIVFTATAAEDLPRVTIELTDHHHVPVASITHEVRKGRSVKFVFPSRKIEEGDVTSFGAEGMHLRVGEFNFTDHGQFSESEYAPIDLSTRRWTFGRTKSK